MNFFRRAWGVGTRWTLFPKSGRMNKFLIFRPTESSMQYKYSTHCDVSFRSTTHLEVSSIYYLHLIHLINLTSCIECNQLKHQHPLETTKMVVMRFDMVKSTLQDCHQGTHVAWGKMGPHKLSIAQEGAVSASVNEYADYEDA